MKLFRLHKFHDYEGYKFPWYVTLIWITFFASGVIYIVKFLLLNEG